VKDTLWEGNKLHLYVTNGAESVPKISELAGNNSAQILTLSLSRPSLDDVFLKYTGSSMDDSSEESGDEWWKQWAGKGGGGKWQQQWDQGQEQATDGNESNNEWQEKQWPQTGQHKDSAAAQTSVAATPTGSKPPQRQWSAEEMAQWQNSQEDNKTAPEDVPVEGENKKNSGDSWPDQQDWLKGSGDDKWAADKKWSGNPSKK